MVHAAVDPVQVQRQLAVAVEFVHRGPLGLGLCDPGERQFLDDAVGTHAAAAEQPVPAKTFVHRAEDIADADDDAAFLAAVREVGPEGFRVLGRASELFEEVDELLGREQGGLRGILLLDLLEDDVRDTEKLFELFGAGRGSDMADDALVDLVAVSDGLDDLDLRSVVCLLLPDEHAFACA